MSTNKALAFPARFPAFPPPVDYPSHVVHFYDQDHSLVEELTRLINDSLKNGDSAIVVATKAHHDAIARQFRMKGVDMGPTLAEGRYVSLDAAETLSQILIDGMPDLQRFTHMLGGVITKTAVAAKGDKPCILIFGEMVAILWAEEKYEAAIRLEELWNELAHRHSFSLRCAYPMNVFRNDKHGELFMKVCSEHTAVIPEGNNGFLFSDEEGLRTIAKLQQRVQVLEHERVLHESEQRFRLLVEAVQDYAIFMLDAEGRVRTWNIGAERIKGYTAAEILGNHFSCFYPEEEQRLGKPQRMLEIATREGRIEDQGWRVRKDGTRFWANAVITALRDKAGNLTGFSKVTRDFTERRLAEQALLESQRKINESEKSLRQLSHHLLRTQDEERQRIGRDLHDSLGQYLSMLKMKLDSIQTTDGAVSLNVINQKIEECVDLAEESIKEVRTISYLLYPPLLEELGLQSAISWYLEGFTKRSGIKTTLDVPAELGRFDRTLELAIFRVLQESLTNVHRHSGSSTADVRVWVKDGILTLEVRDHGKGICVEGPPGSGQDLLGALGVGLRGMNERMRQLGGSLDLTSSSAGTAVTAAVPAPTSM